MTQGGHASIVRMSWAGSSSSHGLLWASRLPVIAGLTIFLLFALPAAAQETTKDLTELSLEDLMKVEVYSASKHMQKASDAPSSESSRATVREAATPSVSILGRSNARTVGIAAITLA